GSGAMIISPQGRIVAQADGPDGLAIAEIDPRGQREGGDALNWQRDMRARLFRERNPEAFRILTDTNPPVLAKVPIDLTQQETGRIMARALTVGEEDFKQANGLIGSGKTDEAISAFERLRKEYPATWIDRRSQERHAALKTVDPVNESRHDFSKRAEFVFRSGLVGEGEGRAGGTAIELSDLRQDRSADFSPLPAVLAGPERAGLKSALLISIAVRAGGGGLATRYPGDGGIGDG